MPTAMNIQGNGRMIYVAVKGNSLLLKVKGLGFRVSRSRVRVSFRKARGGLALSILGLAHC